MKNVTTTKECLNCKLCCSFTKEQKYLAPYFSKQEVSFVEQSMIKKNGDGTFQAKVVTSKNKKGYYNCVFLNESDHKCVIYKKRPLDCVTWPFIIGWDKNKKDIFLWISNKLFCPAVKDLDKIKKSGMIDGVILFLKSKLFFEEIKKGERFIWPYAKYQIKLKKITKLIK